MRALIVHLHFRMTCYDGKPISTTKLPLLGIGPICASYYLCLLKLNEKAATAFDTHLVTELGMLTGSNEYQYGTHLSN